MRELWEQLHTSACSLTFENANGRITSGTRFKVGEFLITNNHVIQVPSAERIVIRSVHSDGYSTALNISLSFE
jgi:hypothetical protein